MVCQLKTSQDKSRVAMIVRNVCSDILSLMLVSEPEGVSSQELSNPATRQKYAEAVCSECHAALPNDTASKVAKATAFETVANSPGMNELAISVWLQTTHPSMPNIVVKPNDISDVAAYIVSLKD